MSHVIDTTARLAWVEKKLRPYQLPSVRNLVTALSTHNGALDASDTGTGKTYVAAAAAYVLHRPLFVVCPKTIIPKWEAVGRKFRIKIKAMGYERLRMGYHSKILVIDEKGKFVWKLPPETIIAFDECFVAGTKIQMADGTLKNIESVKKGDKLKNATGIGIVRRAMRRKAQKLCRVQTVNGAFICTPEHPILTQQGWILAGQLNESHYIKTHDETMRMVWQPISGLSRETFLRQLLCGEMENGSAFFQKSAEGSRTTQEDFASCQSCVCSKSGVAKVHVTKDERSQSDEKPFYSEKDLAYIEIHGTPPDSKGRKRNGTNQSRKNPSTLFPRHPLQFCHSTRKVVVWLSQKLQSGYSLSQNTVWNRMRRGFSYSKGKATPGREEGFQTSGIRVVCSAILEQEDFARHSQGLPDCEVFNLEVAGHPSYCLENGEVVHNCHRLMHPETENSRIGIAAFRQGYTLLGLSATAADHPKKMKFVGTITKLFPPENFSDWLGTCKYKNRSSAVTAHMHRIHNHIFPGHGTRIRIADLGSAFPTTQITAECYAVDGVDKINAIYQEMADEIADIEERELQDAQKVVCVLTARLRASQRAEILKVPAMVTIARDAMEEGKSVAIFLNFRNSLDALVEKLKLKCKIYGGQSDKERQEMLRLFQTDVERGIGLNIRCGGIGLDLQGKNRLSLINPGLSSSDLKQVFGRVHRDGGEHSEQRIFFTQGTIEEENYQNVMTKIGCIDTLNDGDLSPGHKIRVVRSAPRPHVIVPPLPPKATTSDDVPPLLPKAAPREEAVPPVISLYGKYQIT